MLNVMASAAEAEVGGLFINGQAACPLKNWGIVTDNQCAEGIANDTVKQKRSKAIDMRFYWIRDRVDQKQFQFYWRKGSENLADYFTKHHPASHHQRLRSRYLQQFDGATRQDSANLISFALDTSFKDKSTLPRHTLNE